MNGGQSGGGYPQPPAPPPSIRPGTTLTRVSVQVDFALRDK